MSQGWIRVHRSLLDWEWFSDHNTFRLFVYLMLKANHNDNKWRGILIKRGQHLTSLDAISLGSCLTKSQVRTSLNKLKLTREIAHESSSQHTVITMLNYNLYQADNIEPDTPMTHQSHTDDTPIASNKNDKNEKNENKIDIPQKKIPSRAKGLTEFPSGFEITQSMVDWFEGKEFKNIELGSATESWVDAMKSKGNKYKDWKAAWRTGMNNAEKWGKK